MKRKHYDLIIAWANGEDIEYREFGKWIYVENPAWIEEGAYRIKQKTININGFPVPEPVYQESYEETYFIPNLSSVSISEMAAHAIPSSTFKAGFVFRSRDDAATFLMAILSFTQKNEKAA
jgi:hypothetical protein